eukprot:TRINITY_DN201_c0_g4_i1.p1 TRINITY_DN201_c0_g4~~TRINITY_DN201_c0_g4_i1.p1  ORF type:complete len:402 (-),score=184.12 TRINITY_DN201_c0_g4_i1:144-1301(-)
MRRFLTLLVCLLFTISLINCSNTFSTLKLINGGAQNLRSLKEDDCNEISCSTVGDECDGDLHNHKIECEKCCEMNLLCVDKTCIWSSYDNTCETSSDCKGYNLYCNSESKKCDYIRFAQDACTTKEQCYGNMLCDSGFCKGIGNGAACLNADKTGECAFNNYCSSENFCVAQSPAGSSCTADIQCQEPAYCYIPPGVEGVCRKEFSEPIGADCYTREDCQFDLACNFTTNKCESISFDKPSDVESCETDSDCTNGVKCACDQFYGKKMCVNEIGFYENCTQVFNQAMDCSQNNKCTLEYGNWDENNCAYIHCKSEFDKAASCACPVLEDLTNGCFYLPIGECAATGLSTGAIVAIVIIVIVAVAVVAGIVGFVIYRRKQDYETLS